MISSSNVRKQRGKVAAGTKTREWVESSVRWKGYGEDTWEHQELDAIAEYYDTNLFRELVMSRPPPHRRRAPGRNFASCRCPRAQHRIEPLSLQSAPQKRVTYAPKNDDLQGPFRLPPNTPRASKPTIRQEL